MARRLITVLLALTVILIAAPYRFSSAQSAPDPTAFALPQSAFPPGSQIVDSAVAANTDVDVRYFQLGPAPPAGRLTGYYMQARAYDSSGRLRLVTSYLVSIYATTAAADTAFTNQWAYWHTITQATENPLPLNAYGDPGRYHWFAVTDSSANTHSELFFERGAIVVQMNLDSFGGPATAADVQAFLAMATTLDTRAGRPPTLTPTPTTTATRTPVPTRTPTPRPTSRPTARPKPRPHPGATRTPTLPAVKPIKETPPCKKGQRRVKGKCRKR